MLFINDKIKDKNFSSNWIIFNFNILKEYNEIYSNHNYEFYNEKIFMAENIERYKNNKIKFISYEIEYIKKIIYNKKYN